MARKGKSKPREPRAVRERRTRTRERGAPASERGAIPAPLPPETRTVGQLVAESIRLYGRHFWRTIGLGVPPAVVGIAVAEVPTAVRLPLLLTVAAAVASLCYAVTVAFMQDERPPARVIARATGIGIVALEPAIVLLAFLGIFGLLPAVAWLGFIGFVVPVAVVERRSSFRRAVDLARADLAHAIGSLATLALVGLLAAYVLFFTLRSAGTAALRASAFLSVLVISPLLFLGAALLYYDQRARVGSAPRPRRRDADVHPAVQPDGPGRANAEGESGKASRGEQ